jgi:pimeloyl-ACP methyl ester carboxylesterase
MLFLVKDKHFAHEWRHQHTQCDLGDFAIFYETHGSGRPIVMLPGIPSDHHIMERFMEPLFTQRASWQRIYPDLPGTGLTPGVDRLATQDQMIDAVQTFIDTVIPGQHFVLAGYSYGGYLTRGIVSRRAALIDGLLLCAPAVTAPPAEAHLPKKTTLVEDPKLMESLAPGIASLIVVQSSPVVEKARTVAAEVQLADHTFFTQLEEAGPASFEVDAQATRLDAPTLILTARQDNVCGYRDAWDLLENYPRATFAVLDRAGHFMNIEQYELCHALMYEWLDRVEEYSRV